MMKIMTQRDNFFCQELLGVQSRSGRVWLCSAQGRDMTMKGRVEEKWNEMRCTHNLLDP